MATGEWFVQVYTNGSGTPEPEIDFPDFASMLAFIKEFKKRKTSDLLRAHIPARTSDLERQELILSGAVLN